VSEQLLRDTGFCFLFAPAYHGAMRHAAKARAELGIKSAMNLVGPLSNPADASYQLIGVFDPAFCGPVAEAAHMLGVRRVMVVHGEDGQDEASVSARTLVVEIDETGAKQEYSLSPEEFGITRHSVAALRGGTAADNARTAVAILDGGGPEAIREAVLLNAGAALYICGSVRNIGDGYLRARRALESGEARATLTRIRGEAVREKVSAA
jgi:anthranilate synthase/phosphoribosyltransferase